MRRRTPALSSACLVRAWHGQLPSLTVLRLNHNRLETLGEPALGKGLDSLTSLEVRSAHSAMARRWQPTAVDLFKLVRIGWQPNGLVHG